MNEAFFPFIRDNRRVGNVSELESPTTEASHERLLI